MNIRVYPSVLQLEMKQKKYGKKIQNWHRPLGRTELKQRFRVKRMEDAEYDRNGELREYFFDDGYRHLMYDEDKWPRGHDPHEEGEAHYYHRLDSFLRDLIGQRPMLGELLAGTPSVAMCLANTNFDVEDRLVMYTSDLVGREKLDDVCFLIREMVCDLATIASLQKIEEQFGPQFARRICLFSPFWIRSPIAWSGTSLTSLLDHLFTQYKVPSCLYQNWVDERDLLDTKWFCWFILFAQGGSVRRVGQKLDWQVNSRFLTHLFDVPCFATPIQACMFSQIMMLGGSEKIYHWILCNTAFHHDVTNPRDADEFKFWQNTIRWLAKHEDQINDEQAQMILDWAQHLHSEASLVRAFPIISRRETGRRNRHPFSWKGRNLRAVLQQSLEYHQQIQFPFRPSNRKWDGHSWDCEFTDQSGTWTFTELLSDEQLLKEGLAMSHCVGGYSHRCETGSSAIVSVRQNGIRRATLEINPQNRSIVQARGKRNRGLNPTEQARVAEFKKQITAQPA